MVIARTLDGEIGLLTNHAPMIGILYEGSTVQIRPDNGNGPDIFAAVSGGFLSMANNRVSILARQAQLGQDVDTAAAQAALDQAIAEAGPAGHGSGGAREHPVLPGAAAGSLARSADAVQPERRGRAGVSDQLVLALAQVALAVVVVAAACLVLRRRMITRRGGVVECCLRCGRQRPMAARPGRIPERRSCTGIAHSACGSGPHARLRPPRPGPDRQPPGRWRGRRLARAWHDDRDLPGPA